MSWIDWLIVILPLFAVAYVGFKTQKYVKGVSDFLAARRVAGRYVVAVANGEAAMGLISVVAMWEMYYNSGFAIGFWGRLTAPISIVILLTGFAIYRYRETRAMTMGQFFEIRYSKRFRIFAGCLQATSGILNYALFPAVGARFLMYFCDLPSYIHFLGFNWPMYGVLMAIFLSVAVLIANFGGQITIMTTDCIQGIISYPMYLIVVVAIMFKFSWFNEIAPTLLDRPPGKSMLNPFDTYDLRDFNLFYIFVGLFGHLLNIMSWSGTQGYNAAAATPHEQKMGRILGTWRSGFSVLMYILLAVAAYTFLHNAAFQDRSNETLRKLKWKTLNDVAPQTMDDQDTQITSENLDARAETLNEAEKQVYKTIYSQMRVPVALRELLPVGVTGVFCAVMIFLMISTDTTYLHSWGAILVQDIALPLRKKPFTPRQQLFWLRFAITSVAIFAFFFSYFFGQVTFILMFFALTGSLWLGGAGSVIVGGLYWKRGTTQGAWTALAIGSGLATLGGIGTKAWVPAIYPFLEKHPALLNFTKTVIEGISRPFHPILVWEVGPEEFPINGQEIYFLTMVLSISTYVIVSLLTCKEPFNMDRMLHRGKYRRQEDRDPGKPLPKKPPRSFKGFIRAMLGIDDQFTVGDKILSWSVFLYSFGWGFGSWVVILVWNLLLFAFTKEFWSKEWWAWWFFIQYFVVIGIVGLVSTFWFMIGGAVDLRRMFKRLAASEGNVLDDGRVIGNVNADDIAAVEQIEHTHIDEAHEAEKALEEAMEEEQEEEQEKQERKKHHSDDDDNPYRNIENDDK